MNKFEENKFYLLSGEGKRYSEYDGPFNEIEEAFDFLKRLCGDFASTEIVATSVIVHFMNNQMSLVKDDNNEPINGAAVYSKKIVVFQDKRLA